MYPLEAVYSLRSHEGWLKGPPPDPDRDWLKETRRGSRAIVRDRFWEVDSWDALRAAVSFLTLMNKREVLYFRGQGEHFDACLPVLFRDVWWFDKNEWPLTPKNRRAYYDAILELRDDVLAMARMVRTPREYVLEHVPAATAAVLQHYELWPTHFVDVTRSLPIALAFALESARRRAHRQRQTHGDVAYLYVFGMPDLRGSITSDIDQHVTLARLEAICPPAAKRPHHQDAYLVSRFPEPPGSVGPADKTWKYWQDRTDLMRRLIAKFQVKLSKGVLPGAPRVEHSFLVPPDDQDPFGLALKRKLSPKVVDMADRLSR